MSQPLGVQPKDVIYRWDLDKTYLRTEFDTLRDLVRTAFEPVSHKHTVPGAASLMRELRPTTSKGIHILSGSPEQMRRVLEAKLRLDGVEWDTFVLKPSLRKLLCGKFRFLRDQLGYKLGALLASRVSLDPNSKEVLFGDDAEADAFVYSLYADVCNRTITNSTLLDICELARLYKDDVPKLLTLANRVPKSDAVHRIFIHLDRVSSPETFSALGPRVCAFYNYFQAALVLVEEGILPVESALRVGTEIVIEHSFGPDVLIASAADMARRMFIGEKTSTALLNALEKPCCPGFEAAHNALQAFREYLRSAMHQWMGPKVWELAPIDYIKVFEIDIARIRAARLRASTRRFG